MISFGFTATFVDTCVADMVDSMLVEGAVRSIVTTTTVCLYYRRVKPQMGETVLGPPKPHSSKPLGLVLVILSTQRRPRKVGEHFHMHHLVDRDFSL